MSGQKVSPDDDTYWQSSKASRKSKNVFDDDVDYSAARRYLTTYDDDDDDDLINFDGSTVESKVEFKSARFKSSGGDSAVGGVGRGSSYTHSLVKTSSSVSGATSSQGNRFPYESGRRIDDVVQRTEPTPKKQPTLTELSKLEAKISCLERNLDSARRDKFPKLPPRDLVKSIILGQPFSLEMYKSKEDKLAILDEAIKLHDGNAITAAILHLQATVKTNIFNHELMLRPKAIEHYLCYLHETYDYSSYRDTLGMLGRSEDEAMFEYKQTVQNNIIESKVRNLKTCYRAHFERNPSMTHAGMLLQQQVDLLERQLPVEAADDKGEKMGEMKFKELPRKVSITNQPLITTLYYCCLYHYGASENLLQSPEGIRKKYMLTEKQFMWTALRARALRKQWNDIQALFQTKNWLGGTKMKSPLGFDRVLTQLHKQNAPRQILNKYCNLIDGSDRRIELGQKMDCHEAVLEAFMHQKDRLAIMSYQGQLRPQSQEWFFAKDMLQNTSVKWKN